MNKLEIFDPAMCCSTGVCGPNVEPHLVKLAADVAFLKSKGIQVERYNLGHQPQAFVENPAVLSEMGPEGEHLPIFVANGNICSVGQYPDRTTLASWFGLEAQVSPAKERVMLGQVRADPEADGGSGRCC